ncbi:MULTISPECIES: CheR family methyltransferase [Sphingobacterium]|uniref:Protein-glutamate O-methyltransferase CheR n=1 Tax=Sphingobacterium litopenaei TaxID=2763500 RepID=A0ABR7YI24_9SPHI|nr:MULTISPECIES: protein-glutamate O-methyltransferase CheR [Sphingobacterium]MBD1430858.1 protein-glutamate O-methyltransferase CheR [Sphingobacterium litopenaei]NGM74587.1 protein-glutamate O-methyltransferase CheR [Sphingobacterium sp. SGL-16]
MAGIKNTILIEFEELEEIIYLLQNISEVDLSGYSKSSLKRRVERFLQVEKMDLVDLKNAIVNVKDFHNYFIQELVVNVTEMFRDPQFFVSLKKNVIPYLKTYPQIRIWSAGCSTGEEAYSTTILLNETNILDRSFIYGTDISPKALEIARKGVYSLNKIKSYTENYLQTSPTSDFSSHYTAMYDAAIINKEYRSKVLFSTHNLVSDHAFNEFQLIMCRNVMIYFDKDLQKRVLKLFYDSLSLFGFLCLGSKESLYAHEIKDNFKVIDKKYNIYQKIK